MSLLLLSAPSVSAFTPYVNQNLAGDFTRYWSQYKNNNRHFVISVVLFRPRSTGTVRLASANPFAAPLIDPAYFSERADLASIVAAMRQSMGLIERIPQYMTYSGVPTPGCQFCEGEGLLSQCISYLTCTALQMTFTSWHPVGTCRMGNASSTDAVLDQRLRVRGFRRLRVIDSSIMPTIGNSNPNAATMMIAERGAQMIRDDNRHT